MWSGIGREEHDNRKTIELTIYSQHPLLGQANSKQRFGEKKKRIETFSNFSWWN